MLISDVEVFIQNGEGIVNGSDFTFILFGDLNFKFILKVVEHFSLLKFCQSQIIQIAAAFQFGRRDEKVSFQDEVEFVAEYGTHFMC